MGVSVSLPATGVDLRTVGTPAGNNGQDRPRNCRGRLILKITRVILTFKFHPGIIYSTHLVDEHAKPPSSLHRFRWAPPAGVGGGACSRAGSPQSAGC